jgi:uncharacterized protein
VLFVVVAEDHENGLEHRLAVRPSHLKHLETLGEKLVLAGPFLDADEKPCGSLMVIDAADQAEAEALVKEDPFVKQGVFKTYRVRRWNWGINNPSGWPGAAQGGDGTERKESTGR